MLKIGEEIREIREISNANMIYTSRTKIIKRKYLRNTKESK